MSETLLTSIRDELVAIRELLAERPAASTSGTARSSGQVAGEPPQPTSLIENPGDVQVHFGKNNGVALSALSERSLAFYASVKEPRLDSSGKPFPPRPQDVKLENAARQLYHQQKGTLGGGTPETRTERPATPPPAKAEEPEGEVPF